MTRRNMNKTQRKLDDTEFAQRVHNAIKQSNTFIDAWSIGAELYGDEWHDRKTIHGPIIGRINTVASKFTDVKREQPKSNRPQVAVYSYQGE